jgi:hypothetical protein
MSLHNSVLWVCDGCGATVLATKAELGSEHRWKRHTGMSEGGRWTLLLCPACEPPKTKKEAA